MMTPTMAALIAEHEEVYAAHQRVLERCNELLEDNREQARLRRELQNENEALHHAIATLSKQSKDNLSQVRALQIAVKTLGVDNEKLRKSLEASKKRKKGA